MVENWKSNVDKVNKLISDYSASLLASEGAGFFSGSFYGVVDSYLQSLHMHNGIVKDSGGRVVYQTSLGLPFENGRVVLPPELS